MAERVAIEMPSGFGLATVIARKGVAAADIGRALGIDVVDGPRWSGDEQAMLIGTGPGTWLAYRAPAADDYASQLQDSLRGIASVADQSGAYALFRISGDDARALLQRGVSIDLHPSRFTVGSVATTMIAHIGVILWQTDDLPAYTVAVFRSYRASFQHWLDLTAASL